MTAPELKPCPFCGGEAEIVRVGDRRQSTQYNCTMCGCFLETGEEWGHGTAWNRRAPDPAALARIADLEAKADALDAAAQKTWDQACKNHEQPPPVKYMAPYGGLVELHTALAAYRAQSKTPAPTE